MYNVYLIFFVVIFSIFVKVHHLFLIISIFLVLLLMIFICILKVFKNMIIIDCKDCSGLISFRCRVRCSIYEGYPVLAALMYTIYIYYPTNLSYLNNPIFTILFLNFLIFFLQLFQKHIIFRIQTLNLHNITLYYFLSL